MSSCIRAAIIFYLVINPHQMGNGRPICFKLKKNKWKYYNFTVLNQVSPTALYRHLLIQYVLLTHGIITRSLRTVINHCMCWEQYIYHHECNNKNWSFFVLSQENCIHGHRSVSLFIYAALQCLSFVSFAYWQFWQIRIT